jgi:PAS domain S-box-containing protein
MLHAKSKVACRLSTTSTFARCTEFRETSVTGFEFPVEISLSPLQTEEGTSVSGSIRDIIERRRTEAQTAHHFRELTKLLT